MARRNEKESMERGVRERLKSQEGQYNQMKGAFSILLKICPLLYFFFFERSPLLYFIKSRGAEI